MMGCLSERYRAELSAELPEVDRFYGKYDWTGLASDLARVHPGAAAYDRVLATGPHHAYIKSQKVAIGSVHLCHSIDYRPSAFASDSGDSRRGAYACGSRH